uniref:Peroxisomal ATPase PEX1 N-terminal C-lobe domain-containing protein n=1 Tax=Acrobeloides nanus TaxID=290746 RepID=A0A914D9B3_9BILA
MKLHGIQESEQVMLHNVNSVNFCDCIEIMPASLDDWNIIQSTAFVIEEIFLDQIRVVQKGMRFVLNVFDNLSVNFQVISIIPENIGDAPVIVSTTTQVLVVPWEEKKDSKTSQSSSIDFIDSRKFTSNLIDDFVGNFEEKFSRVLPDSLGPENLNDLFAVPTVIVLDEDPYVKPCVVSLYSPLIESPCYAIKLAAVKGVNQELDQLQETLERRKGHCWISKSVRKMGLKDAMQVKIHPVTKNLINITYLLTEVYDLQEVSIPTVLVA